MLAGEIFGLSRDFVKPRNLGKVFAAETGFFIERDPDTVRAPDVSFLAKERIPSNGISAAFVPVVPDLAVEVKSPSDTWRDLDKKAIEFVEAGVRLVWVVDPSTKTARSYRAGRDVLECDVSKIIPGEDVLPGFELKMKDLF